MALSLRRVHGQCVGMQTGYYKTDLTLIPSHFKFPKSSSAIIMTNFAGQDTAEDLFAQAQKADAKLDGTRRQLMEILEGLQVLLAEQSRASSENEDNGGNPAGPTQGVPALGMTEPVARPCIIPAPPRQATPGPSRQMERTRRMSEDELEAGFSVGNTVSFLDCPMKHENRTRCRPTVAGVQASPSWTKHQTK